MLYEIPIIGSLNALYTMHVLLLIGINYGCNGLCVHMHREGTMISLQVSDDGLLLRNTALRISVDGVASTFTTNNTGSIAFFAPLKIGANYFTLSYMDQKSTFGIFYLGGMAGLVLVPIGAVFLLAFVKFADFSSGNKRILLYFNEDGYQGIKATIMQNTMHRKMPFIAHDNSEPYIKSITETMLNEALSKGSYYIGSARTAGTLMANNDMLSFNSMHNIRSLKNRGRIRIAVLNAYEHSCTNFAKYVNSDAGCMLLYMHATGSLEVIALFGS